MKLTEMARLVRAIKSSDSAVDRDTALNCLLVPLVKAYAARHGSDELEMRQVLLQLIWESELER